MDFCASISQEWLWGELPWAANQFEEARSNVFRCHPTSGPLSFTSELLRGTHLPRHSQDLLKSWKMPVWENQVTLFNKYPKRPLQKPKSVCLPELAWLKRAKKGSLTLNAANRQPRVGITDDIWVCYAISLLIEWYLVFGNVMLRVIIIKQNFSKLLTWTSCTYESPIYILWWMSVRAEHMALPWPNSG